MADINNWDRDAFGSFQVFVGDLFNGGRNKEFYSRGDLLDNNADRNATINAFTGGEILDIMMV